MEWLFEVAAAKAALTNTVFVKADWARPWRAARVFPFVPH